MSYLPNKGKIAREFYCPKGEIKLLLVFRYWRVDSVKYWGTGVQSHFSQLCRANKIFYETKMVCFLFLFLFLGVLCFFVRV